MNLVDKIKSINFVGTFEGLVDVIRTSLKMYSVFSKDPKVILAVKALDVYDQIKEKKLKDITSEDAIKLAEIYDQYKPEKEEKVLGSFVIVNKPIVAEPPASAGDPIQEIETLNDSIEIINERKSVASLQLGNADPHNIIGCYGGATLQTVAQLPIDFEINYSGGFVITIPKSTDNMWGDASPGGDHMLVRRGIVVMVKDDKVLAVSDFNSTQYDNRFANLGANKILSIHVRKGKMISRTKLTQI